MRLFGMTKYVVLVLAIFGPMFVYCQIAVYAGLDTSAIKIGEQTTLSLLISSDYKMDKIHIDDQALLSTEGIEVIGKTELFQKAANEWEQSYVITSFDSSLVSIPSVSVVGLLNRDSFYAHSNELGLFVQIPVLTDSVALAPIKPIITEQLNWTDALPWVIGFLVLGLLLLLYRRYKNKLAVESTADRVERQKSPHEIAMERLEVLRGQKLWQQGEIKVFQSTLTNILREYLENRFHIQALESTTSEILGACSLIPELSDRKDQINELLHMADMVKFAKAKPPVDIHERYLDYVESFVMETKYIFDRQIETESEEE